jgi:hypothetical protein
MTESSLSIYYHNGTFQLQFNNYRFHHWLLNKTKKPPYKHDLITLSLDSAVLRAGMLYEVACVCGKFFSKVNVTTLPTQYQTMFSSGPVSTHNSGENPYQTLFLDSKAPMEVVKAAYKALSRKHHPDVGGDADKFRTITDAYRRIRKDHRSSS